MATNTITPAEVGGLWVPANPEHAKLGWTYDFDQVERIAMAAHKSTGYDATLEVVDFVMAEADRRHATALAAKDAELAETRQERMDVIVERNELRAQLAEARKALEPFADAADDLEDDHKDTSSIWECPAAVNIDAGHLRAARRALEAQGGHQGREGGKADG